jgi:hypothetical protein
VAAVAVPMSCPHRDPLAVSSCCCSCTHQFSGKCLLIEMMLFTGPGNHQSGFFLQDFFNCFFVG